MELKSAWQTIPGESPIDPSHLKDRSITTRAELSRAEALNIRKAYVKYLAGSITKRSAPFDYDWLLRLHKEMYCDVWEWAGKLRQIELNMGIGWINVSQQLLVLAQDISVWAGSGMSRLEQSICLHHRAVWIHPFSNGNGRWARLLANIWLRLHKTPIIIWPEESIGHESIIRNEYIKALNDADNGDYGPLLSLHKQYQEKQAGS
jgi:Fic-DOC domain mobile mystery protein B